MTYNRRGNVLRVDLDRGASEIVEFTWNPRNIAVGDTVVFFAVLDEPAGEPVQLPNDFANWDTFHNFCLGLNNVAYRRFQVVA
jgi:hypothetical protein